MNKSLLTSVLMGVMLLTSGICKADITQKIAGDYKGTIKINLGEGDSDPIPDQRVSIVIEDDLSTIRFTLYDFNFTTVIKNENIILDSVPVEEEVDGTLTLGNDTYSKDMSLGGGVIQAKVKFDSEQSYIDGDDILVTLNITWQGISFVVTFEGAKVATGIESVGNVSGLAYNGVTHLLSASELEDSAYSIYAVNGAVVKIGNFVHGTASLEGLSNGIYFVKSGASVIKIVKK